jgi:hypothetical protein
MRLPISIKSSLRINMHTVSARCTVPDAWPLRCSRKTLPICVHGPGCDNAAPGSAAYHIAGRIFFESISTEFGTRRLAPVCVGAHGAGPACYPADCRNIRREMSIGWK